MKKAEARLEEEKNRVGLYLHQDIMNPLMKACLGVLVTGHSALLRDEFQVLLDTDRQEDLARMYRLLARIVDGLEPLRTKFEAHVRKSGLAAVEKVAAEGDNMEPKTYVDALTNATIELIETEEGRPANRGAVREAAERRVQEVVTAHIIRTRGNMLNKRLTPGPAPVQPSDPASGPSQML